MFKFIFSLIILLVSGVLIGKERQKTHGIVGVRSVTLIMLGAFIFSYISTRIGGDPSRVVAQVVSGVGFIGAGLMIKKDSDKIANITTAILMWCIASLGCLIGLGFIIESIIMTLIILLVLKYYKNLFKDGN
ncbi:MAG: MgtC/SapB family protein [Bacilli bacterium]|nr:MgtC/SapB family protein [Bacilli bacterium]